MKTFELQTAQVYSVATKIVFFFVMPDILNFICTNTP